MAQLTREELLSGRSLKHEEVTVPELGGEVSVYELAPRQRVRFAKWCKDNQPAEGSDDILTVSTFRERLLALTLRSEGQPLFVLDKSGEPLDDDVRAIGETVGEDVLDRLSDIARNLSGIGDDAIEAKADELPNSPDASAS